MPTAAGIAAAFGVYLVVAVALTLLTFGHTADVVVLLVVAGTLSWWATVPGALGIGLLGWPFYSGFIAHSHAQLGITGSRDAVVLAAMVGTALVVVAVRAMLSRGRAPIPAVPMPRLPD
jgi:hypothetical protein